MALVKERKFLCSWESCDKQSFDRTCDLSRHYRIHTNERPYACDICDKRFNTKNSLKVHRRVHTGEKPYSCDFSGCGRCFAEMSTFLRHRRTHLKEKPYFCSYGNCQRWFSRKAGLNQHQKRYHSEELTGNYTASPVTLQSHDSWPYSDSVPSDTIPPLDIIDMMKDGQMPDYDALPSFNFGDVDAFMRCESEQSIQVAQHESAPFPYTTLNQSTENFVRDTSEIQHQYLAPSTLENLWHFPLFPYQ